MIYTTVPCMLTCSRFSFIARFLLPELFLTYDKYPLDDHVVKSNWYSIYSICVLLTVYSITGIENVLKQNRKLESRVNNLNYENQQMREIIVLHRQQQRQEEWKEAETINAFGGYSVNILDQG